VKDSGSREAAVQAAAGGSVTGSWTIGWFNLKQVWVGVTLVAAILKTQGAGHIALSQNDSIRTKADGT
jgi:hypothetical protein